LEKSVGPTLLDFESTLAMATTTTNLLERTTNHFESRTTTASDTTLAKFQAKPGDSKAVVAYKDKMRQLCIFIHTQGRPPK